MEDIFKNIKKDTDLISERDRFEIEREIELRKESIRMSLEYFRVDNSRQGVSELSVVNISKMFYDFLKGKE